MISKIRPSLSSVCPLSNCKSLEFITVQHSQGATIASAYEETRRRWVSGLLTFGTSSIWGLEAFVVAITFNLLRFVRAVFGVKIRSDWAISLPFPYFCCDWVKKVSRSTKSAIVWMDFKRKDYLCYIRSTLIVYIRIRSHLCPRYAPPIRWQRAYDVTILDVLWVCFGNGLFSCFCMMSFIPPLHT